VTTRNLFMGVDPGMTGAAALLTATGDVVDLIEFEKHTIPEVSRLFFKYSDQINFAILEKVASRPGQGAPSTFKFGRASGIVYALLIAYGIPFEEHIPQLWMKYLKCMTQGDKNVTKEAAQRLFPGHKWTLKNSDAVLIAEYCRRLKNAY